VTTYLRLNPELMRVVADDLDAAAEASRRLGATVPTLADGCKLPPDLAREAQVELGRIGAEMRRAAAVVQGLGRDVRARAALAELADQTGKPGGLPGGRTDRLQSIVENFECPLDDPVGKLLHEVPAMAAEGAALGLHRMEDALTDIVDGRIADTIREAANEELNQCQPPVELPAPPPPPPPPPPKPGFLERIGNAAREVAGDVEEALEDLPSPGGNQSDGPFPLPAPPPIPILPVP
jgi:hypothetical protein